MSEPSAEVIEAMATAIESELTYAPLGVRRPEALRLAGAAWRAEHPEESRDDVAALASAILELDEVLGRMADAMRPWATIERARALVPNVTNESPSGLESREADQPSPLALEAARQAEAMLRESVLAAEGDDVEPALDAYLYAVEARTRLEAQNG